MSVFSRFAFVFFASIMAMALDAAPLSKYEPVAGRQVIEQAFPDVTRVIPLSLIHISEPTRPY